MLYQSQQKVVIKILKQEVKLTLQKNIYEFGDFEFLLSLTIWYEVLFAVNSATKILQSKDMHIDVAINQLKTLINFFKNYREIGFVTTMSSAIETAKELEIEPVFKKNV